MSSSSRAGLVSSGLKVTGPVSVATTAVVVGLALLLSARLLAFIDRYAVNLLYVDHWAFYDALIEGRPVHQLFLWQHGPHRMGVGFLLIALVAHLTQWDARSQSFLVAGGVIGACALALFLKRKISGSLELADIAIPLVFLTLRQQELFLAVPNLAHGAAPLFLLMLFALALLLPSVPARYACVSLVNLLTIYTGFGYILGVVTPIVLAFDVYFGEAKWRVGKLIVLGLNCVFMFLFFSGFIFRPALGCYTFLHPRPWEYGEFVLLMFSSFVGVTDQAWRFVVPLVLAFAAIYNLLQMFRTAVNRSVRLMILALSLFSLGFSVLSAIGRVCSGVEAGASSRYVTYVIPAFFACYLTIILVERTLLKVLLVFVFCGFLIWSEPLIAADAERRAAALSSRKAAWKECYLTYEDMQRCDGEARIRVHPNPSGRRVGQKLQYLKERRLNLYKDVA